MANPIAEASKIRRHTRLRSQDVIGSKSVYEPTEDKTVLELIFKNKEKIHFVLPGDESAYLNKIGSWFIRHAAVSNLETQ